MSTPKKKAKLTDQQKLFCQHYLVTVPPNAKQAALLAGYSPESAESQGSRLLRNAQVKAFISKAQAKTAARFEVEADEVLKEIHRLAMVDVSELFDKTGKVRAMKDLPPSVRRAIASVETQSVGGGETLDDGAVTQPVVTITKVKFWDKTRGLEMLARHLGLFVNKLELSGKVGVTTKPDAAPELTRDERRAELRMHLAKEAEANKTALARGEPAPFTALPLPDDVPHRT